MTNVILDTIAEVREDISLQLTEGAVPRDVRSAGSKPGVLDKHRTRLRNLQAHLKDKGSALVKAETAFEVAEEMMHSAPWNAKKKAAGILEQLLTDLAEAEDIAEEENIVTEGNTEQAIARLPEIENTIKELMTTAATALLSVGQLLNEAREEFDSANEFLAWAKEKFEFKKAYVYRLMKVADEFGHDEVLAGQSINVLNKLAGMPEEVKQAAREKVEGGEQLTGKAVQGMGQASQEGAETGAEPEQGESTGVDEKTSHAADLGDDEGAPWHEGTGREVPTGEAPKAAEPAEDPEVKRLRELVSELQAELAAARQERESKAKGKGQAPMLPQFVSDCYYARLGLSVEQGSDPAEVRKAFRALVKAGYSSQHEAYPALVEAKDELMKDESKAA